MIKEKSYSGIDIFRFIAALLIIAIHTSPLGSYTEIGDFILTRVIGRVAVPFFLMISGFFMISRNSNNSQKFWKFIKRTLIIYVISILIYIPINIYNGYFKMDNLFLNILKDIFFDGTLYHLWYLPASIIGIIIARFWVNKLGYIKALFITGFLYILGMLGDSYYGLIENISFLKDIYEVIFIFCDYTRNGIFFTPVFFVLGGFIASKEKTPSHIKCVFGVLTSFSLMLAEALLLNHFNLQRHDSMYIMLIPCMYFLFSLLSNFEGKRYPILRDSSLIIYIIHPMIIVAIRLFAKILSVEHLFIENSGIHFISVALASVVASFFITLLCKWKFTNSSQNNKKEKDFDLD